MSGRILECNQWCISEEKARLAEATGMDDLDKGDVWIRGVIDLKAVIAIKETDEDDGFCGPGKAEVLLHDGRVITTDQPYEKVVEQWKKALGE